MAERRYSQQQRYAIASAYSRHGVTAGRVAELAAAGELEDTDGQPLDAFTVPKSTVRGLAREAQREAVGKPKDTRASSAPGNTVEALRQRLLQVAHEELEHEEAKPVGDRDLERIRQATRCALEARKLPTGTDSPPPSVASGDDNGDGGSNTTGLVGALIAEHRRTAPAPAPAHEQPTAPRKPDPETEPETEPETALERLRAKFDDAELRADIERIKREQQEPEPPPVDDTARLEERARRRRPMEDTDSIVPGSFVR